MISSSSDVFHKGSGDDHVCGRQQRERACDNDAVDAERYHRAHSGGYRRHRQQLIVKNRTKHSQLPPVVGPPDVACGEPITVDGEPKSRKHE